MRKVLVIDTSILCVHLGLPGMEDCGPDHDKWNQERVAFKLLAEQSAGTTFVLPLATIIETGNHIAQLSNHRREMAMKLAKLLKLVADAQTPWARFSHQGELWTDAQLRELASKWPEQAVQKISLGDATIKDVAAFYQRMANHRVEILTGDLGLKALEPAQSQFPTPRRRG